MRFINRTHITNKHKARPFEMILTENITTETFTQYLSHAQECSLVFKQWIQDDKLLTLLNNNYNQAFLAEEMTALINQAEIVDEPTLKQALRFCRKAVVSRLILRDLNGLADLDEVMLTTSTLAEVCLNTANAYLSEWLSKTHGQPQSSLVDPNRRQTLQIIGMGKLGGYELNVSSDIDLIFTYESKGRTDGESSLSHQEFFTRIAKQLIQVIDDVTADGFVFRVDMRLRPFGSEGALVCSFDALEEYYQKYGREWERYAWIKGRVIKGDHTIERLLSPFIYRKYLDYGALANMRDLKKQIQDEVYRKDLHDNIKLGRGGIREIEFIAQAFQLMRGGQEHVLQVRPTLMALTNLVQIGHLSQGVVGALTEAYVFLRNLEHRLQYYQDKQTHDLPTDDVKRDVIVKAMGYSDWAELITHVSRHRQFVAKQFDAVFAYDTEPAEQNTTTLAVWQQNLNEEAEKAHLIELGYEDPASAIAQLTQFRHNHRYKHLPEMSIKRLNRLMPSVIEICGTRKNANACLQRMVDLIETICKRASYLAFFAEYPQVLGRLVAMVGASPWIASYLGQHPFLLDSLTDNVAFDAKEGFDIAALEAEITERMQWLNGDTEQQMNALREFQQQRLFTLAREDVIEQLPMQILSDRLSELADLILRIVMKVVWPTIKGAHRDEPKFAIIAYGKHGGRELSYLSDLDLVFIFDDDHPEAREVYSRYGMRIISWLNTMTSSGILYETDMQLRPDGNSGLLVISRQGFERYQREKAWVWEHQALTRARFAVGDASVGEAFEKIRADILLQPRDLADLKAQVLDMRERMKKAYRYVEGQFDLKKSLGGMIDIEFIVQYLVLAHAHHYPELLNNVGNVKILSICSEAGLIPEGLANSAAEAYLELRRQQHAIRLQGTADAKVPEASMQRLVDRVRELWQFVFYDH